MVSASAQGCRERCPHAQSPPRGGDADAVTQLPRKDGSCYQPGRCHQEPSQSRTTRGGSAPAEACQAEYDLPAPEALLVGRRAGPSPGGCPGSGPDSTRPVPQSKRRAAGPPEATPSNPPPQKLLAGSSPGAARWWEAEHQGQPAPSGWVPPRTAPGLGPASLTQAQTPCGHPGRRTPSPATSRQSGPERPRRHPAGPLPLRAESLGRAGPE